MKKRKIVLLISLFVIFLLAIRTTWYLLLAEPNHKVAEQGVLDLRDFDFNSNRVLTLNGEWEFYLHELLIPNTSITSNRLTFIQVPGNWGGTLNPETNSKIGYGTYRLRVWVKPDPQRLYSIRLSYVVSASTVFVNGHLVGSSGKPAEKLDQNIARNVPYTATFTTDLSELDIVVQVANYDHLRRGGIISSIKLGNEQAVERDRWFSISMQVIVCTVLVMHAIYVCLLYLIGTRQKTLLSFFILILFALLMTLLDDDRLLLYWLPIDYAWSIKLIYLAIIGVAAFLMHFAKSILVSPRKANIFYWFFWICAISAIVILFTPAKLTTVLASFYFGLTLIASIILLVLSVRTAATVDEDAIFISLGICSILTNVIGGYIKGFFWPDIGYYPIDLIVAFLMFASFWFKRYFRASTHTAELASQLQAADKMKDIFLANTSHELRNPLHGMVNIAQTVLEEWDNEHHEKKKADLELLVTVGKRMSFLLNDLLDLTRLKENGIRLDVRPLKIQGVANGVTDMMRFMLQGKSIRLINQIPDKFPAIVADENRFTQILFNLVHNAIKYTNEGSITLHAKEENNMATISVIDTGIGMDEQTLKRIFQPYEQGDNVTQVMSGGIGLGLSIAKQLVEMHGGIIEVYSEPDHGSHFRFSIPLAQENEHMPDLSNHQTEEMVQREISATAPSTANDAELEEQVSIPEDRITVLAVDDDPVNLQILGNILSSEKYDIIKTTSGKEALSILEQRELDLVVTDVMMPIISGYELTRIIRERYSLSELPVLILTARSQIEDIHTGFLAGANDYVSKPVDAQELRSRVKALTDMKQSARERLRMEAAWLQAQIEPHFLFNTLNAITALKLVDSDRMSGLLEALTDFLQASFDFSNSRRLVPLSQELDLVRSYLYIEKVRFDDKLKIHWDIDDDLELQIPPLSIQPLVENAIRHGVLKRLGGGTVRIQIMNLGNCAEIVVSDDGVGMDESTLRHLFKTNRQQKSGIGLLNTHRRLQQIYGKGLQIQSQPDLGTKVSFTVCK
ncbi:ATP-binding protein [uncultured Brevibacillus sp.]|uniref:hybrid sensor histidine kinase/response regulator n=1 Tax=uncultured Brevibacillus sp. TaxID=169970 RepID=UPI0025913299|nr:ATP-binding protein [uncultured Brevibacillus sp.]